MTTNSTINLYHGSWEIVSNPQYGVSRIDNDYGQGFYCTKDIELAKEWACSDDKSTSWCNSYTLDLTGLNILDLTTDDFTALQWLALLMDNRNVNMDSQIMRRGAEWLIANHLLDISKYDVIIGYRADDSFFRIARAFISNTLPLEFLEASLRSGDLGIQYTIKSECAFNALNFIEANPVDYRVYYPKRTARSQSASDFVFDKNYEDGTFLSDIIRR